METLTTYLCGLHKRKVDKAALLLELVSAHFQPAEMLELIKETETCQTRW